MTFQIDKKLHWTDHYVQHGFAVVKNIVAPEFCEKIVRGCQKMLGTELPPAQWSTASLNVKHALGRVTVEYTADLKDSINSLYDQPGVRSAIATMLGSTDRWDGERTAGVFVSVHHAENKPELRPLGHVDFLRCPIPLFGSGMGLQVSMVKTEPFSGNITIYPGLHKVVQKYLMEHPDFRYADDGPEFQEWCSFVPKVEPFEFVAEPGDGLFFHHLVGHNGNINAAKNRSPRVAIHSMVQCTEWPSEIGPASPNMSPWERSLALNGPFKLGYDERNYIITARTKQLAARAVK